MDLFAMSSSLEGIPRCMMEAMAMGIPVAAYNIPGVDRLVEHGKTGLLASFGDTTELKQCWERLLFDEPFRESITHGAREHIHASFSAQRMAREYTSLYREMVLEN
jgi:glycosyltransferase involved in cell wall biosynthesis